MTRAPKRPTADPRFRTVPEPKVLKILMLAGFAFEVEDGGDHAEETARRASLEALDGWVAQGLGFEHDVDGQRCFDPVEVVNVLKWLALTAGDRFWADRYVSTGRRLVGAGGGGRSPAAFAVSLRRSFDLSRVPKDARLRLRAPLLLADETLRDLEVTPWVTEPFAQNLSVIDDSILLRFSAGPTSEVTLGADFRFVSSPGEAANSGLLDDERALYLRETEGLIRLTPGVCALAQRLCTGVQGDRAVVASFWRHLIDDYMCGAIRYSEVPFTSSGDYVLETGWYDCQLGSALLVSLCRASAIPARLVSGHLLYPLAPTNHYWAEIWFDGGGWAPYDLLCWDLSEGGQDMVWRDAFAGKVDHRAVTQRLPSAFTGPMSVRFPPRWHMVQIRAGDGIEVAYINADTGALIYKDHVTVERLCVPHPHGSAPLGTGPSASASEARRTAQARL